MKLRLSFLLVCLSCSVSQAQGAREVAEAAIEALSAGEKLEIIREVIEANGQTGDDPSLNATCIVAMHALKARFNPMRLLRRLSGGVSDPSFNACVAEFCTRGEPAAPSARDIHAMRCIPG